MKSFDFKSGQFTATPLCSDIPFLASSAPLSSLSPSVPLSLSSSCLTRGSIGQSNHYYGFSGRTPDGVCRRMTVKSELSSSDTPFLSSSCLTRGSINNEFNLTGFSGRTPDGACRRMTGMECGRSMVEMLGTLAIIGVLSIGGIAGYSYGMDKYRANETLKDINLRVVDLLTQASQGRTELSLAEWENEDSIYDFSDPAYSDDDLIMFDVGATKKLPKSVCQAVFDGLANTAVQIDINAVHSNSNEDCGTDNTMTFYFEGGSNGTGGETTGEQCGSTVCGTCQKCENESCVTVADYEQKCTTDDNKTGWCVSGVCEAETTCNCGEGEYCTDKNSSCYNPTPSGTCKDAASEFKTVDIDGTTYYISNSTMSWWNAVSACQALGKNMLTVEDMVIPNDDDGIMYNSLYETHIGYKSTAHIKTTVGTALYNEMGDKLIWSGTISHLFSDSCHVYAIPLRNCTVYSENRRDNYYVVCK